jgi:hypothetical protein
MDQRSIAGARVLPWLAGLCLPFAVQRSCVADRADQELGQLYTGCESVYPLCCKVLNGLTAGVGATADKLHGSDTFRAASRARGGQIAIPARRQRSGILRRASG